MGMSRSGWKECFAVVSGPLLGVGQGEPRWWIVRASRLFSLFTLNVSTSYQLVPPTTRGGIHNLRLPIVHSPLIHRPEKIPRQSQPNQLPPLLRLLRKPSPLTVRAHTLAVLNSSAVPHSRSSVNSSFVAGLQRLETPVRVGMFDETRYSTVQTFVVSGECGGVNVRWTEGLRDGRDLAVVFSQG